MSSPDTYRIETAPNGRAQLRFPSGGGAVSAVVRDVGTFLDKHGLSRDLVEDAIIALAEALNNVEEHAYAGETGLPVAVDLQVDEASLLCAIRDRGASLADKPLPPDRMPLPDPDKPELWPEGGFGWPILYHLTDDLRYERKGDWNELSFRIPARVATP